MSFKQLAIVSASAAFGTTFGSDMTKVETEVTPFFVLIVMIKAKLSVTVKIVQQGVALKKIIKE